MYGPTKNTYPEYLHMYIQISKDKCIYVHLKKYSNFTRKCCFNLHQQTTFSPLSKSTVQGAIRDAWIIKVENAPRTAMIKPAGFNTPPQSGLPKVENQLEAWLCLSHTIHVWYICLHLVDVYGKCR